ncbi:hypothetical protein H4S02_006364 [Coemansia sp. RSA 2611]|nr:hypothetical protein H4S02_006364 [Coemansia sp. RSA 2611]
MALTGKELDDSIFGTDSHLDWADEVNMEPLGAVTAYRSEKHDEGVATSPKNGRGGKDPRAAGERRGGGRGQRASVDGGRGDHGGRSGSRGGARARGGRSSSRQGKARTGRERSASSERPHGEPRGWRTGGRARADKVDRWDHDRFDATGNCGRRNSSGGAGPIDIERIGKEGISHVTINRRGSNAAPSGRPPVGADGRDDTAEPSGHARRKSRSGPYASQMALSPRSPPGAAEPYRAPHRRQSSADSHAPPAAEPAATPARQAPAAPRSKPAGGEEDEGSSAEVEWENFVANGGLDIPFDRITDELLKQPRRQPAPKKPHNDNNSEDPGEPPARPSRPSKPSEHGISIRGSAKKAATKAPPQPQPSAKASKQPQPSAKASRQQQQPKPTKPATPATTNGHRPSRSPTPTRPATPARASSSERSSSPARAAGSVPASYLRRQHEAYDEDRGRHVFSVNIPYDEYRCAPIHVHERDDVAKLAAKFARIWRVHGKELRIKRVLTKMKAVVQDDPL